MKRILRLMAISVFALALSVTVFAQAGKVYGKKFKTDNSFPASELFQKIGDQSALENIVVTGEITEVCQAQGCWIRLKNDSGEDVFVKFKDHAFLIPKDLAGRKAFVHGNAVKKTTSVEELRHYAEDAGKSEDEIAAIKEPKTEIRIVATGVIIE